jgi:Domain of unknown function (DUF4345)
MVPLIKIITHRKNAHLLVSSIVLLPIALIYGILPNKILPILFNIKMETIDLMHVFRAIMGLYLGIISLFVLGIYKPKYWEMATLINIAFMGGLAFGRLISIVIDGQPSMLFLIGFFVELLLAFWGIINLKNK